MAVACAAALALAACGEDRDDSQRAAAAASTVAPASTTAAAPTEPPTADTATVETFPPNGESSKIVALDNNFLPQTLTVAAGTEVVFNNNGRNDHNIIPVGDLETVSWGVQAEVFKPKAVYSHVFGAPGTYVYYCTIHGTATAGMVGTIVVTEP